MGENDKEITIEGFTQLQALVFVFLANPPDAFQKGEKSICKSNIAEHLGVNYRDVARVFADPKFLETLCSESLTQLHLHRATVDAALIKSASIPSGYGAADRKLYYEITGIKSGTVRGLGDAAVGGLTRAEKENLILAYFGRISKELHGKHDTPPGGLGRPDSAKKKIAGSNEPAVSGTPRSDSLPK